MSYTLTVRTDKRFDYREILAAINVPDLTGRDHEGPWPEGSIHLHRPYISTRDIEVTHEVGRYEVRFLAMTTPEDYEVGIRLAEQFASRAGVNIQGDEGQDVPWQEVRTLLNEARIHELLNSHAWAIAWHAREGFASFDGPVHRYTVGPRLFQELEAGPEEELPHRMLHSIRTAQWWDLSSYRPADIFELSDPATSKSATMFFWSSDVSYHFPGAEYLALMPEDRTQKPVTVPYQHLAALAGERMCWLDEVRALVQSFTPAEKPALLARARQFFVDPFA